MATNGRTTFSEAVAPGHQDATMDQLDHNMGSEDHPLRCRGYPGKESPGWKR